MVEWGIGLLGSIAISGAAFRRRSLSLSGATAAVLLGTMIYALGSAAWFGTLIMFFISSTLLSKLKRERKEAAESGYSKSGRRDAGQVAANGGFGLLLCIGNALWPNPFWWWTFVGVMSSVTADTWATELGALSSRRPRSITSGKLVAPGTSGGITLMGLGASAAGGLFIGASAWVLIRLSEATYYLAQAGMLTALPILLMIGLLSGIAGSLMDSLLGATVQVMYRCGQCGKEIEKTNHCDMPAKRIRGFAWMTNDAVNAMSSLIGGGIALLLILFIVNEAIM